MELLNFSRCYLPRQSILKTSCSQERKTKEIKVYLYRFFIQMPLNEAQQFALSAAETAIHCHQIRIINSPRRRCSRGKNLSKNCHAIKQAAMSSQFCNQCRTISQFFIHRLPKQSCDLVHSSSFAMKIFCTTNCTRMLLHARSHHRRRRRVKREQHSVNSLKVDPVDEADLSLGEILHRNVDHDYRKVSVTNFF